MIQAASRADRNKTSARVSKIDIKFESQDQSFAGEMKITTSFNDADRGTEVTILCQDIPEGIRQPRQQGISAEAGFVPISSGEH